jgi:hypothetical protein
MLVRANIILLHCNKNHIYVLLFWELLGLSPNFHIHVSVSELYIPRIGPHISWSRIGTQIDCENIYIAHRQMNVEIGTVSAQFLFYEYLFKFSVLFAVYTAPFW